MDLLTDLEGLLVVAVVSALAPLVVALIPGRLVPQVVVLIIGGILVGPHGFDLASPSEVELIANVGLGFVFLLAGFEIDPRILVARPGRLAVISWVVSALAAVVAVGGLASTGYVQAFVPVALALTTTALGTVLPILRESGMLHGLFGKYFLAAGAVGELFPIIGIAVFLSVNSQFAAIVALVAIAAVALILALLPRVVLGRRVAQIVSEGAEATGQTTLRWSLVLLLGLLVLAGQFGLDVVLGAFLAGAVLRHWAPGDMHVLESKLEAVGFGFFIPVFFVSAGMGIDIESIVKDPARMLAFLGLLLVVRGLPVLAIYRSALELRSRVQLMLCTATTLPLVVALTEIGLDTEIMRRDNAAALVGAGVLSVLLFPLVSVALGRGREPSEELDPRPAADRSD